MGSHSEKEYITKTGKFFDGIIVGANLFEATPAATASLLVKLALKRQALHYYIDPMTYAYGDYIDPKTGRRRSDLDWIKSDRKVKGEIIRDVKRSYASLAHAYGESFEGAVDSSRSVSVDSFNDDEKTSTICSSIVDYQLNRVADELKRDEELRAIGPPPLKPAAVFAPYFYIEPARRHVLLNLSLRLAAATVQIANGTPVHAIICTDQSLLLDEGFLDGVVKALPKTGVAGVWLWFSKFLETEADENQLRSFRKTVESLSSALEVYNMHGGYFSLALSKHGMTGISHGVGYGEQKDVHPVIGQSTPSVRYYLRDIRKRLGVPKIERCFNSLGIKTASDFHQQICDCVICKRVVSNLSDFSSFGEQHYSTAESRRLSQTPAAAKQCRYHFILNRIRERDWVGRSRLEDLITEMRTREKKWKLQPIIGEIGHLTKWCDALS